MEILTNYNEDILRLISDDVNYTVPNFWEYYVDRNLRIEDFKIKIQMYKFSPYVNIIQ